MHLIRIVLSGLALSLVTTLLYGQEEQSPRAEFEEELEVTEVLLDVLVTDKQGHVILGLEKDDFVVEDEGKKVDLTGVFFYSNRRFLEDSGAKALGIDIEQVPESRFFVFFFHDQKIANVDAPELLDRQFDSGRKSRRWVEQEMLPGDYVAVVSYDHKLKVQQDFTHNRRALLEAVDRAMVGKDPGGNWPSRIDPQSEASILRFLPKGKELRRETKTIYDGLQVLSEALGNFPGRKNLLLFSIGFGKIAAFGQYEPDYRYYTPMIETLNTNNVAVYTLDLTSPGTDHIMADALHHLAHETGGRYYENATSFFIPLRQISEENNGYYLLSYRREYPAGESGFNNVKVTVRNKEFQVRARRGYRYGTTD